MEQLKRQKPKSQDVYVQWEKDVLPATEEFLDKYNKERGRKPTLRLGFYRMVAKGIFPNTESYYKSYSANTGEWRENGTLYTNCFVDESRETISNKYRFKTLEKYVERGISYLREAPESYIDTVPRWYEQPNYVEVWVEKNSMVGTLESILEGKQVEVQSLRGQCSISSLFESKERLSEIQKTGKAIHILYFGDYDKSGLQIEQTAKDKLDKYGLENYDFKRIGVTYEQIEKYNLPRSLNKNQVELEALEIYAPDEFDDMLLETVDLLFDEEIHEQMLESIPSEAEIAGLVKKKMQGLSREFKKKQE